MAADTSEIAHLLELFELPEPVSARRMFGGWGVYAGGRMFAAVIDGELLLKVDDQTRDRFSAAGCRPFIYRMRGREQPMSYWTVPVEALDSVEAMRPWARLALEAAERRHMRPARPRRRK